MNITSLIIANSEYDDSKLDNLKNPCNDADSIQKVFEELNIQTAVHKNITYTEMNQLLMDFGENSDSYDALIFFFSGHGFEFKGNNYLAAKDTVTTNQTSIRTTSYLLSQFIEILEESSIPIKIIIIDACRKGLRRELERGTENESLAPIKAPANTFIEFSTTSGFGASDGNGNNSRFVTALLKHIKEQIPIEELFKKTRIDLLKDTNNLQTSWDYSSFTDDFSFTDNLSIQNDSNGFLSFIATTNPVIPLTITNTIPSEFNYDQSSFCDASFDDTKDKPILNIIRLLRSHNWNRQNDGIDSLKSLCFNDCSPSEIFVLGRNIYQTGCSNSYSADTYFDSLKANLMVLDDSSRIHLLNGMAYEIYFDHNNYLRRIFKIGRLEEVQKLMKEDEFKKTSDFISQLISKNNNRVIFNFTKNSCIRFDVYTTNKNRRKIVSSLKIQDTDVMYDFSGRKLYEPDDWYMMKTPDDIRQELVSLIAAPKDKIELCFKDIDEKFEKVGFSSDITLQYKPNDV